MKTIEIYIASDFEWRQKQTTARNEEREEGRRGGREEGVARGVLGQLTEPEAHSPWAQNPWRIARDKRG